MPPIKGPYKKYSGIILSTFGLSHLGYPVHTFRLPYARPEQGSLNVKRDFEISALQGPGPNPIKYHALSIYRYPRPCIDHL